MGGAAATTEDAFQITNFDQLKSINKNLFADYVPLNDIEIDKTQYGTSVLATQTIDDSATFVGQQFGSSLNRNGFAIKGLTIARGEPKQNKGR